MGQIQGGMPQIADEWESAKVPVHGEVREVGGGEAGGQQHGVGVGGADLQRRVGGGDGPFGEVHLQRPHKVRLQHVL